MTTTPCQVVHTPGYHGPFGIPSGDYIRNYTIAIPPDYTGDQTWPLIIDFHGAHETPDRQHDNSLYQNYPAGNEYVIVYPAGVNRTWQGAPYAVPGVDDLAFVSDLLSHVTTDYCIDSTRVYASGKSNGGGFVDTLACSDNGDSFAAFAMASPALYTDTSLGSCDKKRPILESHGSADPVIPFSGKKNKSTPDIDTWIHWWGQRDNCEGENHNPVEGYNETSFTCHGVSDVVRLYEVDGLGHCWPSSTGNYDYSHQTGCENYDLDYTPVVLDFFSKWRVGDEIGVCQE